MFINFNTRTTLVLDADSGWGDSFGSVVRERMRTLCFLLNLIVNLKLL